MPYEWAYSAAGGGVIGLLVVLLIAVVVALWVWGKGQANERFKEHKETIAEQRQIIKDLTAAVKDNAVAIDRQTDLMQSWMPTRQVPGARGR